MKDFKMKCVALTLVVVIASLLLVFMVNEHFTFVAPTNIKKCPQGQIGRAGYNFSIANDEDNYCDDCKESFDGKGRNSLRVRNQMNKRMKK